MSVPDPRERPTLDARTVFALFGVSDHTGYRSVKDGTFPIEPLRLGGRVLRFPTAKVLLALGLLESEAATSGGEAVNTNGHRD